MSVEIIGSITTKASDWENPFVMTHPTVADTDLLLVCESDTDGSGGVTATFNDISMIEGMYGWEPGSQAYIWYLVDPPIGTYDVKLDRSPARRTVVAALNLKNVNTAFPIGTGSKQTGEGNSASVTAHAAVGDLIISALTTRIHQATPKQTQLWNLSNENIAWGAGSKRDGGNPVKMSWSWEGPSTFVLIALPVKTEILMATPRAPENAYAVRRRNYTIVSWDPVRRGTAGEDVLVQQYDVFKSFNLNESDRTQMGSVISTDGAGLTSSVYVDVDVDTTAAYRIQAIVTDGVSVLKSNLSDRAVAIQIPSQMDDKEEPLDRKLGIWDEGTFDESIST